MSDTDITVAKTCAESYNEKKTAKEPDLDDQTILSSEENFGTVSVCPGGVVHINLPHCSLKFMPSDFVKFSDLIGQARLNFNAPPRGAKPHLHVISSEKENKPSEEPTD
ncbi:MAG: hypothetical protein ACLP5H_08230 [Desulfomonilaceae bacterium]